MQPCEVHGIAGKSQGILLTFFCLGNSYSNSFNFYSPFLHIFHPFPLIIIIWFLRIAGLSTAFVLFSPCLCSSSQVLLQYVPNSRLFLPEEQFFKVIQFLFTFLPYSSKHRNFVSENCKHTYSIYINFTFSSLLCSSSRVLLSSVPNS